MTLKSAAIKSLFKPKAILTNPSANLIDGPNSHVRAYLDFYLSLPAPPKYAVLINGPWGTGKTHFIRSLSDELADYYDFLFVSLNGLTKYEDLDAAVFSALYPWTSNKGVKIGAAFGKAILRHAKIELPRLRDEDFIRRTAKRIIVFDDLERCGISIKATLGYINQFVERDGSRVIIIADQDRIDPQNDWIESKEKVVGKTLLINDDANTAFDGFSNELTNQRSKQVVHRFRSEIIDVYEDSKLHNLRVLRQSLWDYDRVVESLSDEIILNDGAIRKMTTLFFALSLELKSGRIIAADLKDRMQNSIGIDGEDKSNFAKANERYSGLELYDTILSDEVLSEILELGQIDENRIQTCLKQSSWFEQADEPAWSAVWHSFEREEEVVEQAILVMLQEFADRKYHNSGEILHVFGQMLWLSEIGRIPEDQSAVVELCKKYVDDIFSTGLIEAAKLNDRDEFYFGAYRGLGFHNRETEEFRAIRDYLDSKRSEYSRNSYPKYARSLAMTMQTNVPKFVQEISFGAGNSGNYARVPVLESLDPEEFAYTVTNLPALAFREVMLGFSHRYDGAILDHELALEKEWAFTFEAAIYDIANKSDFVRRDRLSRTTKWTITKELDRFRKATPTQ